MRLVRILVSAVLGVALTVAVVFLVGMRRKSPWLQDPFRRFQRDVGRKRDLAIGGQAGARAGVIHHVGRRSGTPYSTPIGSRPVPGGFVITLPYTSRADWARNVLAAGQATLDHDGHSHRVVGARVVPYAEVAPLLPANERVVARLFDIQEFLRVDLAE